MSEVRGVVVAHGNLAKCIVEAAEGIAGVTGALASISNRDCGPEELEERIRKAVGLGPAVVFVDLASGSCARAARSLSRDSLPVSVITGVNLPMLLDFLFQRDLGIAELAPRLVAKGHAGTVAYLPESPA